MGAAGAATQPTCAGGARSQPAPLLQIPIQPYWQQAPKTTERVLALARSGCQGCNFYRNEAVPQASGSGGCAMRAATVPWPLLPLPLLLLLLPHFSQLALLPQRAHEPLPRRGAGVCSGCTRAPEG
jgi:hypothetical protein